MSNCPKSSHINGYMQHKRGEIIRQIPVQLMGEVGIYGQAYLAAIIHIYKIQSVFNFCVYFQSGFLSVCECWIYATILKMEAEAAIIVVVHVSSAGGACWEDLGPEQNLAVKRSFVQVSTTKV